jgi:hypothetical protein
VKGKNIVDNDYQKQLENEIDRELKSLPDMSAPLGFSQRVMRALQAPAPWYRRSWQQWPLALQTVSMVIFLTVFGGLCLGAMQLAHMDLATTASHQLSSTFAWANPIVNIVSAIGSALVLGAQKLGTAFYIGCIAALALSYALCMGVGTVYFRMGLARR